MQNLTADEIANYQTSLLDFTKCIFNARKGSEFIENWHHKLICAALERTIFGENRRLIINLPPRYSKTELLINYAAWALGIHQDSEFIYTSYSHRLATLNSWTCKSIVQSEIYSQIFPGLELQTDSQAKDEWRTKKSGCVYAAGSGGTITGYGAGKNRPGFGGAIIIDDPHKADEAHSDVMRENVTEWFKNTIESRVNSKDTPIIVIMQRLHQTDLAGWLLDGGNGEKWEHLCIPVLNEKQEPLWPEKHEISDLERMRKADEYNFAGQYMQTPAPAGGGILKKKWWRVWPDDRALPICEHIFMSWDTAYSERDFKDNSCSVFTQWGVFFLNEENKDNKEGEGRYCLIMLNAWHDRVGYPDLREKAQQVERDIKPDCHLIEKKASGQSLVQDLRRGGVHVRTYQPDRDKVSRAYAVSAMIQSGQVFIPNRKWSHAVVDYCAVFPNGASPSSDYVDTVTQALLYLRNCWWVTHPDDDEFDPTPERKSKREAAYG